MPVRKWLLPYLILILVILAFGISTVVAIQRLNSAQSTLLLQAEQNLAGSVFQAERALFAMHLRVEYLLAQTQNGGQPPWDGLADLRGRFDALNEEIAALNSGKVAERIREAAPDDRILERIGLALGEQESRILGAWDRAALQSFERQLEAWLSPVYALSQRLVQQERQRDGELQDTVQSASWQLGISAAITTASLFILILLLISALRLKDMSAQEAAEARQQLREAIESINHGFAIFDADDRLLLFNKEYARIYSESADLIRVGRSFEEMLRHGLDCGQYPEAEGREEEWLAERLERHRHPGEPLEQQLPNGRWVYILERKTKDGRNVGIRVDITDLKRAREEAEQAMHAKAQFLAIMSHEIRTPLGGLIGMLDLMRDETLPLSARDKLVTALDSAQSLRSIVNDILDLSKLEAGKLSLERVAFSPSTLADAAVSMMWAKADQKGLRLVANVDPKLPEVVAADPTRLRQVLINFIDNAIKFTESGEVTLRMEQVPVAGGAPDMRVSVTDQGIGIPEDAQDRLFRDFSQVDPTYARRFGGTGLGLAICARLIEAMDGKIGLSSAEGQGSTFWFSLPYESYACDTTDVVETTPDILQEAMVPQISGESAVLIAEDNAVNQKLITAYLDKVGLKPTVVGNGREALEQAAERRYDLIFMDISMPEMDGIEATQRIRALPAPMGQVPIVALTANALAEDRERCRQAGMNDHLAKPIVRAALYGVLSRWLTSGGEAKPGSKAAVEEIKPKVFDPTLLDELADAAGDAVARDLLSDFEADLVRRIDDLEASAAGDRAALSAKAHSIKGGAASFGAVEVCRLCQQLEHDASEMPQGEIVALIAELRLNVQPLMQAYEDWRLARSGSEASRSSS